MKQFWHTIARQIAAPTHMTPGQLWGLLVPAGRSIQIRRHAASVIVARVQFISILFALLVPLWSVIDLLVFEAPQSWLLVALRVLSAAVFAFLAWPRETACAWPYTRAMGMLLTMLLVPPLFYLLSLFAVEGTTLTDSQRLVMQLYTFMPTIVLGGLAIFPLAAVEIVLLSLPVIGVAVLGLSMSDRPLTLAEHGATLWFMLMMMGVAIFSGMSQSHYMKSLMRRAMTDPLTGAYTRRSGNETLELMFRLASLSGKPLAVAFVDLDHFKSINDTWGHDAGDHALITLAKHLRHTLRRGDVLIRWGGEEFVIVLPDIPAGELPTLVERLRAGGFGKRPDGSPLTASIGIAESLTDGPDTWMALVGLADQRMYQAKRGGRDRAVLPDGVVLPIGLG